VTFWDSLEHVAEPRRDLAAARRLLRPGGLLLVTTDNFDCLVADLAAAAYRATLGALAYPVERVFIDRNFAFFTDRTLRRLIAAAGFDELWLEKMEYPLAKIRLGAIERLALRAIYAAAAVTGRQAQVTLLAERPAGEADARPAASTEPA
jgi:SAM-dependent methyltransferase